MRPSIAAGSRESVDGRVLPTGIISMADSADRLALYVAAVRNALSTASMGRYTDGNATARGRQSPLPRRGYIGRLKGARSSSTGNTKSSPVGNVEKSEEYERATEPSLSGAFLFWTGEAYFCSALTKSVRLCVFKNVTKHS